MISMSRGVHAEALAGRDAILVDDAEGAEVQVGPQRRADSLAGAAAGADEGMAQAVESAAGGIREGKSHD